jgi:hypothetical protein
LNDPFRPTGNYNPQQYRVNYGSYGESSGTHPTSNPAPESPEPPQTSLLQETDTTPYPVGTYQPHQDRIGYGSRNDEQRASVDAPSLYTQSTASTHPYSRPGTLNERVDTEIATAATRWHCSPEQVAEMVIDIMPPMYSRLYHHAFATYPDHATARSLAITAMDAFFSTTAPIKIATDVKINAGGDKGYVAVFDKDIIRTAMGKRKYKGNDKIAGAAMEVFQRKNL